MTRRTSAAAFALITLTSVPAWACGPAMSDTGLLLFLGIFLSIPFWLLSSATFAVMSSRWGLSFWQWFGSTIAAFGASALGAAVGLGAAAGLDLSDQYAVTMALTSPLIANVAYVMWIRSGRHDRLSWKADSVD